MTDTYILDDEHRPVPVEVLVWARWWTDANRIVAQEYTRFHYVSTVFMGLDHGRGSKGPPILFETMVFERERQVKEVFGKLMSVLGNEVDQWRYASWGDAEAGHKAMVRRLERIEAEALTAITPP